MSTDLIGRIFGSYKLVAMLGRGGMATVYRGYQESIDRSVAIKVLPAELLADPNFLKRFIQEARTLAKLTHASILPLYDFGEANDMPYIVMPLMTGGSLADRLASGPLPLNEVVRVLTPVAEALDFAHSQGILHRDVKPNNILFDQRGSPYLADFGIAKAMMSSSSITGSGIIGTPDYMSPEQARGEMVDNRSDIYALGVVAYQCLTGHRVFEATTPMGVIFKHANEPPRRPRELRPDLSQAAEDAVLKALAKSPDERFQTASEFAQALASVSVRTPITPIPSPTEPALTRTEIELPPIQTPPPAATPAPTAPIAAPGKSGSIAWWIGVAIGLIAVCLIAGIGVGAVGVFTAMLAAPSATPTFTPAPTSTPTPTHTPLPPTATPRPLLVSGSPSDFLPAASDMPANMTLFSNLGVSNEDVANQYDNSAEVLKNLEAWGRIAGYIEDYVPNGGCSVKTGFVYIYASAVLYKTTEGAKQGFDWFKSQAEQTGQVETTSNVGEAAYIRWTNPQNTCDPPDTYRYVSITFRRFNAFGITRAAAVVGNMTDDELLSEALRLAQLMDLKFEAEAK